MGKRGHTDLENLLPLFSACHSLVTDGYLRIVREASHLHFIYGDGSRYVSVNHSLPRRGRGGGGGPGPRRR